MKFRIRALQRMREPEELNVPTTLTAPGGWIAVLAVLAAVLAVGVWAGVGGLSRLVHTATVVTSLDLRGR